MCLRHAGHPGSGNIDAFVTVKNVDAILRPGLSSRVRIWLPELAGVLTIPVADRDGIPVVTIVRENKAYEVPVQLGIIAGNRVQVIGGVEEGILIATEGGYGLPEGCPVQIMTDKG